MGALGVMESRFLDGFEVTDRTRKLLTANGWTEPRSTHGSALRLAPATLFTEGDPMTEATDTPITSGLSDAEKKDLQSGIFERLAHQDDELQFALARILGENDEFDKNSFGLTLITPGGTISGLAVTRGAWEEHHYAQFPELLAKGAAIDRKFIAEQRDMTSKAREELELPDPPRRYIHLKEATIRNGGYPISLTSLRVYVDDVIAWSFWNLGGYDEA